MSRVDSLIEIYIAARMASSSMGEPPADLQAEASQAVAEAFAKIEAMRRSGDLKAANAKYKAYRRAMMERGNMAMPYTVFLENRVAAIVRDMAASGRTI